MINTTQSPHMKNVLAYICRSHLNEFLQLAHQLRDKIGKFTKINIQKGYFDELIKYWNRLLYIKRMKKLYEEVEVESE